MSGGGQSRPKNAGWCGPETEQSEGDYTARVFCPPFFMGGLALTAWGPQAPAIKEEKSACTVLQRGRRRRAFLFGAMATARGGIFFAFATIASMSTAPG